MNSLTKWPWSRQSLTPGFAALPLDSFHREVDDLFNNFFRDWDVTPFKEMTSYAAAAPSMDVTEDDKAFTVTAELPGMTEKDFEVTLVDGVLSIKGEKKFDEGKNEGSYRWSERRYGRFERSLTLPPNVNTNYVEARYDNGVLRLSLPKVIEPEKQPKRIAVKSA